MSPARPSGRWSAPRRPPRPIAIAYPCIHGAGATHIDSFAHIFFDGLAWNGYPVSSVVSKEKGAVRNSVLNMKNGIVTRAILFDIPRLKGLPYLEPGTRIYPEDLEAWEKKAGVKVGAGDALLLRWGRWARRAKLGTWAIDEGAAGFDNSVIPWLKQRDVSMIAWETPGYVPQPPGDLPRLALHNFALTMLGIMLIDRADLEAVAKPPPPETAGSSCCRSPRCRYLRYRLAGQPAGHVLGLREPAQFTQPSAGAAEGPMVKKALAATAAVLVLLVIGIAVWARSILATDTVRTAIAGQISKRSASPWRSAASAHPSSRRSPSISNR